MGKKSETYIKLRSRAEQILYKGGRRGETSEEADHLRLIQELEVHQVELELQNEELTRTQRELEDSRNEYYDLYNSAPVGFVSVNSKGLIARVNRAAEEMLAGPGEILTGRTFSNRIHSKDHPIYFSCLKKAADSGSSHACEVHIAGKGGSLLDVRIEAGARLDGTANFIEWRLTLADITGYKKAEKALSKSESLRVANEQTRTILESITDGFMALDMDWRITYFNETGARKIGMKRNDLIGRFLWDIFPHATSSKFYSEYHRSLETDTPVHFEEFYPEPLNQWIECHCYPSSGGLSVYFRDITERKRAEANQALLTDVLRVLNSGGKLHSTIADVLRLIRERAGFDAVGLRLRRGEDHPYFEQNGFSEEFVHEENFLCAKNGHGTTIRNTEGRAVLECTCGLVLSGRTDPGMSCFTENGSFWTNASIELLSLAREADPRTNPRNRCIHSGYQSVGLFPVRAGKEIVGLLQLNDFCVGRFTPDLIPFFESLAQNIGLALQRTEAEEALRESRARLERAQQIANLGSWELDLIKNELIWSDEVYRIFGLQPQEISPTYDGFIERIHPDDRAAVDAAYLGSLRKNLDTYEIEHRVVRKSTGEIRFVHEKCEHFRDASGRIIRSVGMVLDITERKRAEQALRQLNETLEQQVAERTELAEARAKQLQALVFELTLSEQRERRRLAVILHDHLQQLLVAAKLNSEALSESIGTEQKRLAGKIVQILNQSIQVSRSLTAELSPGVLQQGLSAALAWLARWMQENHRLAVELQTDPGMDPKREETTLLLFQSIRELLFNVVKHAGVKSARVEMSRDDKDRLRVAVIDHGSGFDRNTNWEKSRDDSGFGLFSIRERLTLMGGRLEVESTPGNGASFYLVVPL